MENAMTIARTHLREMNPSSWDGTGIQPADFNPAARTYPIGTENELCIGFENNGQDGWIHVCQTRNIQSENITSTMSGYGIDSPQNLADTITDICRELIS